MNTDIKDYQQKVANILARDYFTREEGYTIRTDTSFEELLQIVYYRQSSA